MWNQRNQCGRNLLGGLVVAASGVAGMAHGQVIHEDRKLVPSDGAAFDEFGFSIAIAGGIVAVGARHDDDRGPNSGSASLFHAATGVRLAKLLAGNGTIDDWFGYAIAIADGIVAVGAPLSDAGELFSGSVYLFDALTGAPLRELIPGDGEWHDYFGWSVSIDQGIVAVGAHGDDDAGTDAGAVYLFDALTGAPLFKMLAPGAAPGDRLGWSVAIEGGLVAAGAPLDDDNGDSSGSVSIFDAATGHWLRTIVLEDGFLSDEFGSAVDIDNGVVAASAYRDDFVGNDDVGSVSLFDALTGVRLRTIEAFDRDTDDWFGWSVALDDGLLVAGSMRDDDLGFGSGSAYVYDAATGALLAKLLASDGAAGDAFGNAVALDQGQVAAAAFHDNDRGDWSGGAYLFTVPLAVCTPDLNGDGVLNFFDVQAFLQAFAARQPAADWNGDGQWNFFDVQSFLQAFAAGCP